MSSYNNLFKLNKTQLLEIARDLGDTILERGDSKIDIVKTIIKLRSPTYGKKSNINYSKYTDDELEYNPGSYEMDKETLHHINLTNMQKSERTNYVSGIFQMDYLYNKKLNKHIYLLSDEHNNIGICTYDVINNPDFLRVYEWMDMVIESSNKFVDIFIEHDPITTAVFFDNDDIARKDIIVYGPEREIELYKNLGKRGLLDDLNLVAEHFIYCLHSNYKKRCKYNNLRVHWTDPRYTYLLDKVYSQSLFYNDEKEFITDNPECGAEFIKILDDPKKYILKIINGPRYVKQYYGIPKRTKELLYKFYASELDIIINKYKIDGDFSDLLGDISTILMDSYFLSRFLRKFEPKNPTQPTTIDNVIVYAGGYHIKRYIKFLMNLGFESGYSKSTNSYDEDKRMHMNKCLDISDIPLPYFR